MIEKNTVESAVQTIINIIYLKIFINIGCITKRISIVFVIYLHINDGWSSPATSVSS